MRSTWLALVLVVLGAAWEVRGDAMSRLTAAKLKAVSESVAKLQSTREPVATSSGYDDVRAILHCHSKWSHDSRGTIEEIVAAAQKVGVRVILFTEHPADHYDFITDGHQGEKEGVLLIPGAELNGMLAYPRTSLKGLSFSSPQEQSDMIARTGGLAFICHLEERMDWDIQGITGTEMYNVHADVKEETRLYLGLVNPLFWLQLRPLVNEFPMETYAALQDYPQAYLKRYDELCQMRPHTGVAGNDAHQNIGIKILRGEKDLILLQDALGKKVAELSISKFPLLAPIAGQAKTGDVILALQLDPYEIALRFVSTHLWMTGFSQEHVWEALRAGRAYVAFDWMADPTGFLFRAESDSPSIPMGGKTPLTPGLAAHVAAPHVGKIRLMRNGNVVHEETARDIRVPITEPGVYRAEVWLTIADEERPWILTNPIYVSAPDN
jgi:hypothetical protein